MDIYPSMDNCMNYKWSFFIHLFIGAIWQLSHKLICRCLRITKFYTITNMMSTINCRLLKSINLSNRRWRIVFCYPSAIIIQSCFRLKVASFTWKLRALFRVTNSPRRYNCVQTFCQFIFVCLGVYADFNIFGHISAVGLPNQLSWITNQ